MKSRDATHWVIIPMTPELFQSGDPRLPGVLMDKAKEKLETLGKIIEGPWFHRWQASPVILEDGRLWTGNGAIYYAKLEVDNAEAKESPEVGSD